MNMKKLLAALLALMLMLSTFGAAYAEDAAQDPVLASAYDGEVTVVLSQVQDTFDMNLQSYLNYYAQYGYQMDEYDVEFQASVASETVQMQMSTNIAQRHAADTGYVVTEEMDAAYMAQAEEAMESMRAYYREYLAGYGVAEEEMEAIIDSELAAAGYTVSALYDSAKLAGVLDHLYALGTEGVTITDEEVKAAYDAKISAQKETYSDVDTFINDYLDDAEILYIPENVRRMHCIFVALDDSEATPAEAAADADPATLTGYAKAQAVLAKINGGMDFTEAMFAYNEDSSTPEKMEIGYPIAESSAMYGDEFKAGAMALENIGDVSGVIVTDYGYFILRYADDFAAGAADFEVRKDIETEEALTNKKNDAYSAYIDAMIEKAGVIINDLSPLYHIYVAEVVEATVAYASVSAETDLTDMPAGDVVAKLAAGASLDVLGKIGVDGEEYAFVAVPGTAFKGYVNTAAMTAMDAEAALAVDNAALAAAAEVGDKLPTFTIVMNDGAVIYGELYPDVTPESVGNFAALANAGFYDGLTFHRVIPGFMIQGGDPNGNGSGGPGYAIKGEFSANGVENELSHVRGVLSMARSSAMDSAGSQFFIMHADSDYLDGQYAGFGHVLGGIETVDLIASQPTNSSDKPMSDQVMRTVYVETYGQEYAFTKLED